MVIWTVLMFLYLGFLARLFWLARRDEKEWREQLREWYGE